MTDIAIRVENLSKQYRIGGPQAAYKTLRESLTDAATTPFRRLSSVLRGQSSAASNETIWALKDVSFEVQRGEVVGIPSLRQAQYKRQAQDKHWPQRGGEDHAYFDKLSTRLKVLSRITEPTEGYAEIHGRVGSLLEVGTGFHPELTGRENIYLNGAILGMKRADFQISNLQFRNLKFTGMYVRLALWNRPLLQSLSWNMTYSTGLAFAVAAHLEPEILLVDEVLAVGDAAFQKKCLGKRGC